MLTTMVCPICRRTFSRDYSPCVAAALDGTEQVCPSCEGEQERRNQEAEREREIDAAKRRAAGDASNRIEESGLNRYELGFDPDHPRANTALASWWIRMLDKSVWVYGRTGAGKTRVAQHCARMAVQDRSVRYWPVFDLAARLTETSKRPEAQLRDIYGADLLILDDLGVANMTEARLTALAAIVDRRYAGWDQVRRRQGAEAPTFGWSSYGRRRELGGQVWITSQVPPEELAGRLANVSATEAAAIVRRLASMCALHEAEEVR